MRLIQVEDGYKIRLPSDWVEDLGLEQVVGLEKTPEGILVRSCAEVTWAEVFATKLQMGPQASNVDLSELSGDDLLF
ncbi:hypothetical protein [Candidatus Entotheonella palauensis]|nr:hypothetical protein [Candidatus Entotheonella palauensis]